MTGLGDELRDLPAISANWLLLAATLALVASAAAYYLYDADYFPLRWGGGWFAGLKEFAFDKSRGGLDWSREAKQLGSVSAVVYLLMGLWLVWKPLAAAPLLGTVGVASLWVTSFAAVALVATIFAERTRPPRLLSHLGVNRLPVFALLAVWVLAAQIPVLREPTYHDVRIAAAGDLAATAAAPFDAHAGQVPGLCDAALPSGPSRIDMTWRMLCAGGWRPTTCSTAGAAAPFRWSSYRRGAAASGRGRGPLWRWTASSSRTATWRPRRPSTAPRSISAGATAPWAATRTSSATRCSPSRGSPAALSVSPSTPPTSAARSTTRSPRSGCGRPSAPTSWLPPSASSSSSTCR